MFLRELELDEFRAYRKLQLSLDPAGFRAVGPNASGKSTLLEAIAMLATTRSPRTSSEREIANWQSGVDLAVPPYARVRGVFHRLDGQHQIEIGLSLDEHEQKALRKQIRLDDRPVRATDVVGQFKTVLFSPEDVHLVSGPPGGRRRFLDMAISQASQPYLKALSRYGRVLEQRNSLLRGFARERIGAASRRVGQELAFWDGELTGTAVEVLAVRAGAVALLSERAAVHFAALTSDASLRITYQPHRLSPFETGIAEETWHTPARTFRQAITAAFTAALESARGEELRRGVTAMGPHRDDFAVQAGGIDLGRFGSRGQQRLAVISLKLAELDLLTESAGEPPVLLLDDALSELDVTHRGKIVSILASREAQVCVTATDEADLAGTELAHLPLLRTRPGGVERIDEP
jgi:DNA replication and repair protein RecF